MKTLHTVTDPSQYPQFWNEDWLKLAISQLDKSAMTSEELLDYEMTLSANALAVKNEKKRLDQAKAETIKRLLSRGKATVEEIAEDCGVSSDFVLEIQKQVLGKA